MCTWMCIHQTRAYTYYRWLCSRAAELRAEGYEVLMAYEEAIGFCIGGVVNDKDGVSAGVVHDEVLE